MNYTDFLRQKQRRHEESGFDVDDNLLNPALFPFQKFSVKKALMSGRFALFLDTGMGKTICQLEWGHHVNLNTQRPILYLAPLAVSGQTIKEGKKFGIDIERYGKDRPLQITNYEQLDNITNISDFAGVVLDESSILKNFTGKYKAKIIDTFKNTSYKLACSATPSPNDLMEIANHSEFFNILRRGDVLNKYFVHDGGQTSQWRIKGHAIRPFFEWMKTWAIMAERPSDIGFDDNGYILPKLNLNDIEVRTEKKNNGMLFNDIAVNATNFNAELRRTKESRLDVAANMVNNSLEQWIIWIKQNNEGDYLRKLISDAIEVKGSDSQEYKEKHLLGFAENQFRVLITKTKIAAHGLNYQNCHNQIFASLDFSFESQYQAIRRSYRFGQKQDVNIYLIKTDSMQNVSAVINEKHNEFRKLQKYMRYEN